METVNQISYTFKEKYFQVEPEWRIWRYQYLVRSLVFSIFLYTFLYFIIWIFNRSPFLFLSVMYGWFISSLIFVACIYFPMRILIEKRCRDIGRNGKVEIGIFTICTIFQILNTLTGFLIVFFDSVFDIIFINNVILQLVGALSLLWLSISIILILVCLFQSWKNWDNEWGKDPINAKVTPLG